MRTVEPKTLKAAFKSVFSGPMGKIVMKELKQYCHIDSPVIVPGQPDMTAFNDGSRSVYLHICKLGNINLDKILAESDNQE